MKTIALRFAENFAPECGTIAAHEEMISEKGYVWYGKLGSSVSLKIAEEILGAEDPVLLLVHSGGTDRWWAHISKIQRETPGLEEIPKYYRMQADDFGCWFKVERFEKADSNVMSRCFVVSSGKVLSEASRHSMSPYFIISYLSEEKNT